MDLTLHLGVHGKGVNKLVISKYTEYIKIYYFSDLTSNYVWRTWPEVESWRETPIIIIN